MNPTSCFSLILFLTICHTVHSEARAGVASPGTQASGTNPHSADQAPSPGQSKGQTPVESTEVGSIDKACSLANDKKFCQDFFNSNPASKTSTMKQLVFIALQAAEKEAAAFSTSLRESQQAPEEDMDSTYENLLIECADSYESIVDLIADSTSALLTGPTDQVEPQLVAALGEVETCGMYDSKEATGQKLDVHSKNHKVKQYTETALSVYRVYIGQKM